MIKLAARTLDFYDDDACEIARGLPEEIHRLKVASREEIEELPDRCFALVMKTASGIRRRFPVHTEDSLKLSEAYFDRVRESLPKEAVAVALAKFAAVREWHAAEDKSKHAQAYNGVAYVDVAALTAPKKVAFTQQAWGLTLNGRNHFPLHDADLVKTAVARFPFTREGLAPEQAFLYARGIEKRAAELGVELPADSAVHLYTNPEVNLRSLAVAIEQRKQAAATMDTEVLDQLAFLAGCTQEQGPLEREASYLFRQVKQAQVQKLDAERIVGILQTFDKLAGLSRRDYLKGMADPFAACFKRAEYPGEGLLVDGVDLSKINPADLAARFDEDFVKEFQENPVAIYKSLPDPVKAVVRSLAESEMGQRRSRPSGEDGAANVGATGDPMYRLNPVFANGHTLSD